MCSFIDSPGSRVLGWAINHSVEPLRRRGRTWDVWGIPVDIDWWRSKPPILVDSLCYRNEAWSSGGPSCLAAMIAAALVEEVRSWETEGVQVAGRTWVDLGGSDGYYAVALKLCGARRAVLLDTSTPSEWAGPVLAAAGVSVIVGDANSTQADEVDSACLLYVPGITAAKTIGRYPALAQLVTNDEEPFLSTP